MHIVWFKRDLRVQDNAALALAARRGAILPLYIIEPALWQQPDMSHRQYAFLNECLSSLDEDLKALGVSLIIRVGEAVEVLEQLAQTHVVDALWSHQETWNDWTYQRDKAVKRWARKRKIYWHEPVQNGVIRRLQDRNGWATRWHKTLSQQPLSLPESITWVNLNSDSLPTAAQLNLAYDACHQRQTGGRTQALDDLHSFLHQRGEHYSKAMSSPLTAFDSCSRLSAHLAFGTLSLREVLHATQNRSEYIKSQPRGHKGKWPSAMRSFSGRLRWHCHFIQKLEDTPRFEYDNMHDAYDGLREHDFNLDYFTAWKSGNTGYPMVDACMRALIATGWLNFRMRAMLMSFASYHLWLHWRQTSLYLAQLFTDYEPGIHYTQAQMQSGTTGINSIRIYNPIKQGLDQDPDGVFIRQWLPELATMPDEYIHQPWLCPEKLNGYPLPIVDEKVARKAAADKLYPLRKNSEHKQQAQAIVKKHGSRKSGLKRTTNTKKGSTKSTKKAHPKQQELPF